MLTDTSLIASGNLATSRRTITGVLGQFGLLEISDEAAAKIITDAGLPPRVLNEPDFPIALEQELVIFLAIVRLTVTTRSSARVLFSRRQVLGIENLGVVGMAMRHAPTAMDALEVFLTYPQLAWGHSRMVVRREADVSLFSFTMERPKFRDVSEADVDALVLHCLVLDLVSSLSFIADIVESQAPPLYITFPFAEPADWHEVSTELPCPVHFSREETCLAYPSSFDGTPLPRANTLLYKNYVSITERLAQVLGEDVNLTEQVTRWLWAYTPPLKRGDIAARLAMSERTLTRQLSREDSTYALLLASVQEERARNFLNNRALSIAEVGYRLGYAEPSAFTRAFTKWTGVPPLKWRLLLEHSGRA